MVVVVVKDTSGQPTIETDDNNYEEIEESSPDSEPSTPSTDTGKKKRGNIIPRFNTTLILRIDPVAILGTNFQQEGEDIKVILSRVMEKQKISKAAKKLHRIVPVTSAFVNGQIPFPAFIIHTSETKVEKIIKISKHIQKKTKIGDIYIHQFLSRHDFVSKSNRYMVPKPFESLEGHIVLDNKKCLYFFSFEVGSSVSNARDADYEEREKFRKKYCEGNETSKFVKMLDTYQNRLVFRSSFGVGMFDVFCVENCVEGNASLITYNAAVYRFFDGSREGYNMARKIVKDVLKEGKENELFEDASLLVSRLLEMIKEAERNMKEDEGGDF